MVHNNKSILDSIEDIVSDLYSIENDTAMEHPYIDEYTTTEQKKQENIRVKGPEETKTVDKYSAL